jgi:hypothetical protein
MIKSKSRITITIRIGIRIGIGRCRRIVFYTRIEGF